MEKNLKLQIYKGMSPAKLIDAVTPNSNQII